MLLSSSVFINEMPLYVLPSLAVKYGLEPALILQQVHFWLRIAKEGKYGKFEDGRYWICESTTDWNEEFPFLDEPTIRRSIAELEAAGALLSHIEKNPEIKGEQRKWYSLDYDHLG